MSEATFRLSAYSMKRLDTCDPRLVRVVTDVSRHFDLRVLEGRRHWDRQSELLAQGRSTLEPGRSLHTVPRGTADPSSWLSLAVDVAPYPIDWHDRKRFVYLAGLMLGTARSLGITLRWGGNWDRDQTILDDQTFDDLPHFELAE